MSDSLRKLQLKDLELFKKFSQVCKEHHITYYALGGTLLGAVRHKGFIPWDDDMDIGIPREDYDRFLKLAETKPLPFELHTFQNDKNHYRYFSRIEDPSIHIKRTDNTITEISSAWIDIFPLDGMPDGAVLRTVWKNYILYRRAVYKLSCFDLGVNTNKEGRPFVERCLVKAGQVLPVQKIFQTEKELVKLDRALKKFPYAKSNYLVNAMGAYKFHEMFHKKVYGNGTWYPFEDTQIWGPEDYHTVCTQLYGDYMTPPKETERNHHSSEIME